jgi:hypothetical protein
MQACVTITHTFHSLTHPLTHPTTARHRHTGKWEAHLWDSEAPRKTGTTGGRTRGRQVYLGGYATEEDAAHAYDKAALAYWGDTATLNVSLQLHRGWYTAQSMLHMHTKSEGARFHANPVLTGMHCLRSWCFLPEIPCPQRVCLGQSIQKSLSLPLIKHSERLTPGHCRVSPPCSTRVPPMTRL